MAFLRSRSVRSNATDSLSLVSENFFTAGEAIPITIPLEKADLGAATFQSNDHSLEDLQLLYEMGTAELAVQAATVSSNGKSKPGTYTIRGIQAANLELVNPLAGYLESILVRLVIETDEDIIYDPCTDDRTLSEEISVRRIILHASVHECGHLRDILLFMKSTSTLSTLHIEGDNPYFNPNKKDEQDKASINKPHLTYLGPLPWWSVHMPWRIYSGRVRKVLQICILLYLVFSVVWASWQLYKHVNVIQLALEPLVKLLKVYLDDILVTIDGFLAWFTELSTDFLRPLYIFGGLFLMPLIKMILSLKSVLIPLMAPLLNFGSQLSRLLAPFSKCLVGIWQSLVSSRVALQNIDLTHHVAKSLVMNSFRAIFQGMLRLVGYSRAKSKQKKVIQATKSLPGTPIRKYTAPNASIPVYYLSPATKRTN